MHNSKCAVFREVDISGEGRQLGTKDTHSVIIPPCGLPGLSHLEGFSQPLLLLNAC